MTKTTILAGAAAVLAIAVPASLAAPLQPRERSHVRDPITVSFSELPNGNHVTYGGRIAVGTVSDSGNIVDAMESAARRGVARTSAEFHRIRAGATDALEDMGFTSAQARAVLQGARTIASLSGGRISGADALNASRGLVASGMRYQAQSSAARSRRPVAPAVASARSLPAATLPKERAMSAVGATPQPRRRGTRFPTRLLAGPTGRTPIVDRGPPQPTEHHSSGQQHQAAIPR